MRMLTMSQSKNSYRKPKKGESGECNVQDAEDFDPI